MVSAVLYASSHTGLLSVLCIDQDRWYVVSSLQLYCTNTSRYMVWQQDIQCTAMLSLYTSRHMVCHLSSLYIKTYGMSSVLSIHLDILLCYLSSLYIKTWYVICPLYIKTYCYVIYPLYTSRHTTMLSVIYTSRHTAMLSVLSIHQDILLCYLSSLCI
jgi:hypothetical protein